MTEVVLNRAQRELLKLLRPSKARYSPLEPDEETEDARLLQLQVVEDLVLEIREARARSLRSPIYVAKVKSSRHTP